MIELLVIVGMVFVAVQRLWRSVRRKQPPKKAEPKNRVIVDGSNVMYWGGDPSLRTLRAVITSLQSQGFTPFVVFDANVGYKLQDEFLGDRKMARLLNLPKDQILVVEKGITADERLLAVADEYRTPVVSNDRFRDWTVQHPWVRKKGRMMRGTYQSGAVKWR